MTGAMTDGHLGVGQNTGILTSFTSLTGNWDNVVWGGGTHTFALSSGTQNKWFATGRNADGQLGLGDKTQRTRFTALTGSWDKVCPGDFITIALSAGTGSKWYGTGLNQGMPGIVGSQTSFTPLTGNWYNINLGDSSMFAFSAV